MAIGDPLFVPIENQLGKLPAKTICCCGEDLRKVQPDVNTQYLNL
jgi:hypothetical protein